MSAEGSSPRVEVRLLDRWVMTSDPADVLNGLDPEGGLARRAARAGAVARAKNSMRGGALGDLLKKPYDALRNLRRNKD